MIRVVCNHCGAKLKAPDDAADKTLRCPKCEGWIVVESPAITSPPIPQNLDNKPINLDHIPEVAVDWSENPPQQYLRSQELDDNKSDDNRPL